MKRSITLIISLPLLVIAAEWQSLNGPPAGRADDIAIGYIHEPPTHQYLYIADQLSWPFKSTDGGTNWVQIGIEFLDVSSIIYPEQ